MFRPAESYWLVPLLKQKVYSRLPLLFPGAFSEWVVGRRDNTERPIEGRIA